MGKKRDKRADKAVEQFSEPAWSAGDPAFAAWLRGGATASEIVTPYTVMGLSAVIRSVSIISTTIAGLPLRTYERQGDERVRIPSVFDDPFPGEDGQTQFGWVETVLIHLLLWRDAFLWHDAVDGQGNVTVYRPIMPDVILKVERVNGRKRFTYKDPEGVEQTVGTEQITHIPGPSMDGVKGHPFLTWARRIFSAALAGDDAAQTTLSMGIRLAGLVTPRDGEDIDDTEGKTILEALRHSMLGNEHAGDIAFINRRLELAPWAPTNVQSQHHETAMAVLGDMERLFGVPPHLLADTEKQTSWGTGVAEQNLGFAQFTLKGWSTRIEQSLGRKLAASQFFEFDYHGLFQSTPTVEDASLVTQVDAGIITVDEARKVKNLPPLTPEQKASILPRPTPVPPTPIRQEATA